MKLLDERFLRAHPATALWSLQRVDCAECKFLYQKGPAMRCGAAPVPLTGRGNDWRNGLAYCIDARGSEGACGPDATKFAPA